MARNRTSSRWPAAECYRTAASCYGAIATTRSIDFRARSASVGSTFTWASGREVRMKILPAATEAGARVAGRDRTGAARITASSAAATPRPPRTGTAGIEPAASRLTSERSPTELRPLWPHRPASFRNLRWLRPSTVWVARRKHLFLLHPAFVAGGLVCASLPPFVPGSGAGSDPAMVLRGGVLEPGPARPSRPGGAFLSREGPRSHLGLLQVGHHLSLLVERKRAASRPPSSGGFRVRLSD
jgi:hypothetical protein